MTDKEFCEIESAISGEEIDKVEQLTHYTFTGRELKEYLEQAFVIYGVSGSYGVPENPTITETGRTYWYDSKLQKVFLKDIDGKVHDITKK